MGCQLNRSSHCEDWAREGCSGSLREAPAYSSSEGGSPLSKRETVTQTFWHRAVVLDGCRCGVHMRHRRPRLRRRPRRPPRSRRGPTCCAPRQTDWCSSRVGTNPRARRPRRQGSPPRGTRQPGCRLRQAPACTEGPPAANSTSTAARAAPPAVLKVPPAVEPAMKPAAEPAAALVAVPPAGSLAAALPPRRCCATARSWRRRRHRPCALCKF